MKDYRTFILVHYPELCVTLIMRHLGSDSEFKQQRDLEILAAYRQYVLDLGNKPLVSNTMLKAVINSPCSRFWITEQRAAIVIGQMLKGKTSSNGYEQKRAMYEEIFRRAKVIWKKHPELSVYTVASMVVEQPAPSFYMSPNLASCIISRAKKQAWLKERKKMLRFSCM